MHVARGGGHAAALAGGELAGPARPTATSSLGVVSWRPARWLLLLAIVVLVGTTAAASRGTTGPEEAPSGSEAPAMVVDGADQVAVAAKKQSQLVGLTLLAALALLFMHVGSHPRRAARSAWAPVANLAVVRTAPSRGPPHLLLAPS